MASLSVSRNRELDVIVLGRAGVDLYASEPNTDMGDLRAYRQHVGGSAGNIAVGLARLGLKTGFIGCVSHDALGDFVTKYLTRQGVDLTGVTKDSSGSRTSVAFTEIKPADCRVIIYRNNASDLRLDPENIDEGYIASSKLLVVTGTALSASPSREAVLLALDYAVRNGVRIVFDADYRAYSWRNELEAAIYMRLAAERAQVVIGNREEFDVMSRTGSAHSDDEALARDMLSRGETEIVVMKFGELGTRTFCRDGRQFAEGTFAVKVRKPFGAGDAFAASFLAFLLEGRELEDCVRSGSAAAAMNVAADTCTDAMPNREQLSDFLAQADGN